MKISMEKSRLKEIMLDQKESFNRRSALTERDIDLRKAISTRQIVIVSGIRRCGKSTLLYFIKEKMKLKESEYCYFNFDDERIVADVSIFEDLYNLHLELYGIEPVLFLDEIQNILHWERFVNRMYERGNKIFISGSNANLQLSDVSASLTGRNKQIEMFPFSFVEYLTFMGHTYDLSGMTTKARSLLNLDFNHFLSMGGFPLVLKEDDLELINAYFSDILYRDIVARYRLSQVSEIKEIGLYFASNVSKVFSYSTLQQISGVKSLSSVKDYLFYYEQAHLFHYVRKFDYSLKKQVMNPRKVYVADQAFAHRLGFNFTANTGRILKNIIYLELLRRGKEVFYYSGKNECDFLVRDGLKITEAIQVVHQANSSNIKREVDGLREAMETFKIPKGLIITSDSSHSAFPDIKGVRIIDAPHWLLGNK